MHSHIWYYVLVRFVSFRFVSFQFGERISIFKFIIRKKKKKQKQMAFGFSLWYKISEVCRKYIQSWNNVICNVESESEDNGQIGSMKIKCCTILTGI